MNWLLLAGFCLPQPAALRRLLPMKEAVFRVAPCRSLPLAGFS